MIFGNLVQKFSRFLGEGMLSRIARGVYPPHFPMYFGTGRCKGIQHGEKRSDANSCAQQSDRVCTGSQQEIATRSSDLECVADLCCVHEIATSFTRPAFDTDTICSRTEGPEME